MKFDSNALHLPMLVVCALLALGSPAQATDIRYPVRAGSFYPSDPQALKQSIEAFIRLARASAPAPPAAKTLRALVMPHAGYAYSGLTAAHAALLLSEKQFAKVLLMGPDHFVGFKGAAIPAAQIFQTPLGAVRVHPDAQRLLKATDLFQPLPLTLDREHCLEVVLPFLQVGLGSFELIPLMVGPTDVDRFVSAITPVVDADTLVVVSSDLSHFLTYADAQVKDRNTIQAILHLRPDELAQRDNAACGVTPLRVLLTLAARRGWQPVLLNYLNSGDTTGERSRVVGYAAIAFFGDPPMPSTQETNHSLPPEKGRELVKLARCTLMEKFGLPLPPSEADRMQSTLRDTSFQARCGTFVTLKLKGRLRGCIGNLSAADPLVESVRRNAINAAFHDPRFAPLTEKELGQIEIEVSVLTEPQPLAFSDAQDLLRRLRPNVDGVILRQGHASATFLPQVWEQLPQKEEFLGHLCLKAGLPRDAWKHGRIDVSTYQVQYFEEHK